jgi:hypothetical protein
MRAEKSARSFLRPRFFLDDVSEDIRKLEHYFIQSALRIPVQIEFHDSGIIPAQGVDLDTYEGPIHQDLEWICWEPVGDESSWRLTYRKIRRQGSMALMGGMDGPTFDHAEELQNCPLVEAPASDRIRAHRALPELVEETGALARSLVRSA